MTNLQLKKYIDKADNFFYKSYSTLKPVILEAQKHTDIDLHLQHIEGYGWCFNFDYDYGYKLDAHLVPIEIFFNAIKGKEKITNDDLLQICI